ncbi:hypothetical protein [Microbulbifer taiwanensis]|uniref:Uncharacterized protein n=1 Tax=Microbulbifer taiwanensis TaxID=986746 RepID=A0ABW1YGH1_9GAMM|nr:hypothetical protein [Microbulbifer taiwanensis]
MAGRDGGTPRPWEQNLDRGLVARLWRRPTVISPAPGDRIQRRTNYFTARAQLLAKSLLDRVSRSEREIAGPQVVHVDWQKASPSIVPGSAPAPASPTELRVVSVAAESVPRVLDETRAFPTFAASEELPIVTRLPAQPGAGGTASDINGDYQSPAASYLSEPPVDLPAQPSAIAEDAVKTLTMPPVRGPVRSGRDQSAPVIDANPHYSENTGKAVASLRATELTLFNLAHSTVSADAKAGEVEARTTPDTALDNCSPSQKFDRSVTVSPSHTVAIDGHGTLHHAIARPSPVQDLDGTASIGKAGESTAAMVAAPSAQPPSMPHGARESVRRVESIRSGERNDDSSTTLLTVPARKNLSRSKDATGEAETAVTQVSQVLPDRAPVAHAPAAQSGRLMQPLAPSGTVGPYIPDHHFKSGISAPAGAELSPLPHARIQPANPASAAAAVAREADVHSGDSEPTPLHVPVLTANADGQSENISPSPSPSSPPLIDEAQLARRVERRIMKRLAVDAERRGGWS